MFCLRSPPAEKAAGLVRRRRDVLPRPCRCNRRQAQAAHAGHQREIRSARDWQDARSADARRHVWVPPRGPVTLPAARMEAATALARYCRMAGLAGSGPFHCFDRLGCNAPRKRRLDRQAFGRGSPDAPSPTKWSSLPLPFGPSRRQDDSPSRIGTTAAPRSRGSKCGAADVDGGIGA